MDHRTAIDHILDHFDAPRNYGSMENPTVTHHGTTSGCGDQVVLYVMLGEDETITQIRWEGEGCTISQAAASMLTVMVTGKTLDEAMAITYKDMIDEMGQTIVQQRATCATLALDILKTAGERYRER